MIWPDPTQPQRSAPVKGSAKESNSPLIKTSLQYLLRSQSAVLNNYSNGYSGLGDRLVRYQRDVVERPGSACANKSLY